MKVWNKMNKGMSVFREIGEALETLHFTFFLYLFRWCYIGTIVGMAEVAFCWRRQNGERSFRIRATARSSSLLGYCKLIAITFNKVVKEMQAWSNMLLWCRDYVIIPVWCPFIVDIPFVVTRANRRSSTNVVSSCKQRDRYVSKYGRNSA